MARFALVILVTFILGSSCFAQGIDYLGSTLWSGVCDVKVVGNYAYCAFANGLMILDISNPTSPTFVSKYYTGGVWHEDLYRTGQKLCISGNYVYFAANYRGLQIINVSDPANPIFTAEYHSQNDACGIGVQGNYAYLLSQGNVDILNISNPTIPLAAGNCHIPGAGRDVAFRGNYAYIAECGAGGLQILDISDPTDPTIIGHLASPGQAFDICLSGNYVYLASIGLFIADVSDPTYPILLGSWANSHVWADGVFVFGNYAYLATDEGLAIFDVTDKTHPIQIGGYGGFWDTDVFVTQSYAYVAALTSGLQVINILDPTLPHLTGIYAVPTAVNDVAVSENYAYTACGASALNIVNIVNPSHPVVIGSWNDGDFFTRSFAVKVLVNYAYLATYAGLRIINISNRRNPVAVGRYDMLDAAMDVFIREPYAYIADLQSGLMIVNVSDPTHPTLTGQYDTPYYADAVYVSGDYAYVADQLYGLMIVNISDPVNPSLTAAYLCDARGVYVNNNFAFLAAGAEESGLLIIDISDPSQPFRVGHHTTGGNAHDVYVSGSYAYVAETWTYGWTQGIDIFNISDPTNPTLVDSLKTPGEAYGITVRDNQIFLADEYSMMILNSNINGIDDEVPIPNVFSLSQNYPNPFNAQTSISYFLSKSGLVTLSIYNLLGQKLVTLSDGIQQAGEHSINWNADDFTSGVYFAWLESGGETKNIKMVLLK